MSKVLMGRGTSLENINVPQELLRAELGPIDSAKQTARLKVIYEEIYPETRRPNEGGSFRGNQHQKEVSLENIGTSFVADASAKEVPLENIATSFLDDTSKKTGAHASNRTQGNASLENINAGLVADTSAKTGRGNLLVATQPEFMEAA